MLNALVAILTSLLMVVPGNIDLDNRSVIVQEDGSISTELSFSVEIDGLEVLLPTVIDGQIVSENDAINHYHETGEHLGMFSNPETAEMYAYVLHLRQQQKYGN